MEPLSPFQESLNAIFKGRHEEERERASAINKFTNEWKKLRHDTINPVLEEAAQFFRGISFNSLVRNENGDSTILVVGGCQLIFRADSSTLKISCTCTCHQILQDDFDPEVLDKAKVEDKVRELARIIER